jgi:hypothetical protein
MIFPINASDEHLTYSLHPHENQVVPDIAWKMYQGDTGVWDTRLTRDDRHIY